MSNGSNVRGVFLGNIGQDPNVPKSNWFTWCDLSVFSVIKLGYIL